MKTVDYHKNMCVGCGLCHSMFGTELNYDEKGFVIPNITKDSVEEHAKICPINAYALEKKFSVWGEYKGVYEGWSKDDNIRKNASSGGIITTLAVFLLKKKIVDGIIQVCEDPEHHQKTVIRTCTSADQVTECMGSRYCISSPLYDIVNRIEKDKKYAFIGKPCDVAALKQGMKINDKLKEQVVFTMSFFCAGVPSDIANQKLLSLMGAGNEKLSSFRYRGDGWPGYTTAIGEDGRKYTMTYKDAWGGVLGRDVNKVCRYCIDGIGLYADVACADLWYLNEDNTPDFTEHEGRNIIFSRTSFGDSIIKEAFDEGAIYASDYSKKIESFKLQQEHQFLRRTTMLQRTLPLKIVGKMTPKYAMSYLWGGQKYVPFKKKCRILLGSIKRILLRRV